MLRTPPFSVGSGPGLCVAGPWASQEERGTQGWLPGLPGAPRKLLAPPGIPWQGLCCPRHAGLCIEVRLPEGSGQAGTETQVRQGGGCGSWGSRVSHATLSISPTPSISQSLSFYLVSIFLRQVPQSPQLHKDLIVGCRALGRICRQPPNTHTEH